MTEHLSVQDDIGTPDLDGICSLDAFEALAESRLMRAAEVILNQGAGTSAAVRRNCAAWGQWAINSRILVDIPDIQLRTTVLGTPVSLPVLFAPTALHGLAHPDGEVATARAANRADTLMVLSFTSSVTLEQVAAHPTKLWFQIYWSKDRDYLRHMIDRAATAGYQAIGSARNRRNRACSWNGEEYFSRRGHALAPRRPADLGGSRMANIDLPVAAGLKGRHDGR